MSHTSIAAQFEVVSKVVLGSKHPEDVFGDIGTGDPKATLLETLHEVWRKMAAAISRFDPPGKNPKSKECAQRLAEWEAAAIQKINAGTWGNRRATNVVLRSKDGVYNAVEIIGKGDICKVFIGDAESTSKCGEGPIIVKVGISPINNDLVRNEDRILRHIEEKVGKVKARQHIPYLEDAFDVQDGKVKRRVNILSIRREGKMLPTSGWYSLQQVRERYPEGLDPRDVAWMFNRLIVAAAVTHDAGVVHGAIVPTHFLIHPDTHHGILIDWSYAVTSGQIIKAISPGFKDFYPKEVLNKKQPTTETDLYMAAKTTMSLLRASDENGAKHIRQFFRGCLIENQVMRPDSAWDLYKDFLKLIESLYGRRKFRPFNMKP